MPATINPESIGTKRRPIQSFTTNTSSGGSTATFRSGSGSTISNATVIKSTTGGTTAGGTVTFGDSSQTAKKALGTAGKNAADKAKNKAIKNSVKALLKGSPLASLATLPFKPGTDSNVKVREQNRRRRKTNKCPKDRSMAPYAGGAPRRCGGRSAQSRGPTQFYDNKLQFGLSSVPGYMRDADRLARKPGFNLLSSELSTAKEAFKRKWKK